MYLKKIIGNNIFLSPIMDEDLETFAKFMNDREMTLLTSTYSGIYNVKDEEEYFKPSDDKIQLAIRLIEDNLLIGVVELLNIEWINRSCEIGISIGIDTYRSQGYGREAMDLLLDFAFNSLNLKTVHLTVLAENERAIKLYKSIGFKLCGTLRKNRYVLGKYRDVLIMDLLKEEFHYKTKGDLVDYFHDKA